MIDSVVLSVISFVGDLEPEVTFVIVIPVTKARLISLNLTHLSSNPYINMSSLSTLTFLRSLTMLVTPPPLQSSLMGISLMAYAIG